jgi:hypothetical protein
MLTVLGKGGWLNAASGDSTQGPEGHSARSFPAISDLSAQAHEKRTNFSALFASELFSVPSFLLHDD